MRKLILSMHMSLDGFVEGENKDMSWMKPDTDDLWDDLFSMLSDVDLLLLGRGMWTEYRQYWQKALADPAGYSDNELKYARLAEKTKHIVFSKSMKDPLWQNTEVNSGPLAKELSKIINQPGKNIQIVGGAAFAGAAIDSGFINEYRLLINPVIVAKGKSIFTQLQNRHELEFSGSKIFSAGVLEVLYRQLNTINTNIISSKKRNEK